MSNSMDTASDPSDQPPKPPIIQAIRNDEPPPGIPIGYRDDPKGLHPASESAQQVSLPRVMEHTYPFYYTAEADRFVDNNSFDGLIGVNLAKPDPTIIFHRNESDVGRSIELSVNREVGLVLVEGHAPGTFTMDSTTQAWKMTTFRHRRPSEPAKVICIPDWTAKCVWTSPDRGQISSTFILEYKDRGLVFVDEFLAEIQMSGLRLIQISKELAHEGAQLKQDLVTGLGLKRPNPFTQNVETSLQQTTTYAVAEGAPNVGLLDYQSLIMFEFCDLQPILHLNEVERLRAGPGRLVRVLALKDNPGQIRRNIIGAWIKSIRVY